MCNKCQEPLHYPKFLKILALVQAAEAGGTTQTTACAFSHKSTQALVSYFGLQRSELTAANQRREL